ncbi:MAG TPA: MarR family transcriptional regulator [Acidimicrobiales bacterium]
MSADSPATSSTTAADGPAERPTEIDDLAVRLRLATARLARQLRQQAGSGLSPSQHSVLASIDVNGSLTLGELAAIEQVAPPTITRIVAKLADDGLVARTVDPGDRRVARVSVTPDGHRRIEHSRSRRDAWLAKRLVTLAPADVARLAPAVDVLEELASGGLPVPPVPPVGAVEPVDATVSGGPPGPAAPQTAGTSTP